MICWKTLELKCVEFMSVTASDSTFRNLLYQVHSRQKVIVSPFSVRVFKPVLLQDIRCKPLSWLNLSQMCSYVMCLHVMHPLCPIEKIVQMDQISSRLTRCHRHLTLGVGRFISHSSICARERVHISDELHYSTWASGSSAHHWTTARASRDTHKFWFHALVDKADRAQRTGSRWPNLVFIRHEYLVRSVFDSKVP